MTLSELARAVPGARLVGDGGVELAGITDDSRAVGAGDLFVAVRGRRSDGHQFAAAAVAAGAAALVVEEPVDAPVPQLAVPSATEALGLLAARFHGEPASRLAVVGITGTNGKTTTTYLIEAILAAAGAAPGVLGTVSYRYGGREVPAPYTTPTPIILQRTLADMVAAGCDHAVLEASSVALEMGRLIGMPVRVAAFSNLTQDHLDVHGDMAAYQAAKALLFSSQLAADGTAVVNVDDPAGEAMAQAAAPRRVLRVSSKGAAADVRVTSAETTVRGVRATIETPRGALEVTSRALLGGYNVDNIALAVGVAEALGIEHAAIARGIAEMPGVPGRVERVENDRGLDILVDYAHTPDALHNVLGTLRPLAARRLICVFGCGGDRDPKKRPLMGAAVAELADLAVVTSDNPRTEDPQAILEQILPAVPSPFFVDADRRVAIHAAVAEATPGDIVLIAGKGHEDYQILGTEKVHFDDREVAAEACAARLRFSLDDVVRETGGEHAGGAATDFERVIIDGRGAAPGDLYVAIAGERFDGHDFCAQAVAAGARGLLVARSKLDAVRAQDVGDAALIAVDDPRAALGLIARFHRRRWGGRVVGVTGSAGKTTTKDLTAAALSAAGRVHTSRGSLNNETGVPLTLLGLRPFHDTAVVEMGMRGLGQIRYLAELAEPEVGVIVNAGTTHVGVVGSAEAIVEAKSEIYERLPASGCAIYPADDPRLAARAAAAPRRLSFGDAAGADVRLLAVESAGAAGSDVRVSAGGRELSFRLALVGRHSAINATAALAACVALGVDPETAARGLERARPPSLRGELRRACGRNLLVDCYNANPAATRAALGTLAELAAGGRALAVLGDMLELGDEGPAAHRAAGEHAASLGIAVVALGELARGIAEGAAAAGGDAEHVGDAESAARAALARTKPGDWILLKASRGMKLERVAEILERHDQQADG